MAGVAVLVTLDSKGVCEMARLVYLNVGDGPVDAVQAAEILTGQELSPESIEEAVNTAAKNEITPFGNVHASPDYQKHLCKVLTRRAINTAVDRAKH